ncbi:MAG: FecR domain-containing protein [Akkermansiaceae bacterium]|nr:FecR domain-containing protein [Akkermansiaceae bacterium]NNM29365.1 FecR domain-containing protein [Akkermansiaceae bacterium]
MPPISLSFAPPRGTALAAAALLGLLVPPVATAGSFEAAHVTKVVNDVRIYRPDSAMRKARPGDLVQGRTSVQTGRRSRSELRFEDQTLTRLGANSVFSFEAGTRELHLEQGTLLLQVPKNSGGARINMPTVTASVTGTTIMMEYFANQWAKMIVLEGSLEVRTRQNGKRRVRIKAGEMAVFRPNEPFVPKPVKVDVKRLMKTSALANPETFGALPKEATDKISATIEKQEVLTNPGPQASAGPQREDADPSSADPPGAREVVTDRADDSPPKEEGPRIFTNLPRFNRR